MYLAKLGASAAIGIKLARATAVLKSSTGFPGRVGLSAPCPAALRASACSYAQSVEREFAAQESVQGLHRLGSPNLPHVDSTSVETFNTDGCI